MALYIGAKEIIIQRLPTLPDNSKDAVMLNFTEEDIRTGKHWQLCVYKEKLYKDIAKPFKYIPSKEVSDNFWDFDIKNPFNSFSFCNDVRIYASIFIEETDAAYNDDVFERKAAENLFKSLLFYYWKNKEPNYQTLETIMEFLKLTIDEYKSDIKPCDSTLEATLENLVRKEPNHPALHGYFVFEIATSAGGKDTQYWFNAIKNLYVRLLEFNKKLQDLAPDDTYIKFLQAKMNSRVMNV